MTGEDKKSIEPPSFNGILDKFALNSESKVVGKVTTNRYSPKRARGADSVTLESPSKRSRQANSDTQVIEWKPLLRPGLKCVFVGFNPGTVSMAKGHYYAHHSNLFWKLIYESGIVKRKVTYEDDIKLQDEAGIGFTDLVARSTTGIKDLAPGEFRSGVPILEERLSANAPGMVVIVGKGIWDAIHRAKRGKPLSKEFSWGLQTLRFAGCRIYVVPSTSGLVGGVSRDEKLRLWKQLSALLDAGLLPK
jgi:TDG/mug DNA glycosylase family protein